MLSGLPNNLLKMILTLFQTALNIIVYVNLYQIIDSKTNFFVAYDYDMHLSY